MTEQNLWPLLTWRSAVSSEYGPPSAVTRHVLLALSLHMNEKGGSCFPSIATQAKETGYSRQTIMTHLLKAEQDGWLLISQVGLRGQRWRRNDYQATIPEVVKEVDQLQRGGQRDQERRSTSSRKVVNQVDTNSSVNSSKNTTVNTIQKRSDKNICIECGNNPKQWGPYCPGCYAKVNEARL